MAEPSYEEIPYEGRPVPASAPASLALTARAHGGPRPSLEAARVLELGCGDGANLLPLAFHHPGWSLVGVDTSERAIAAARAGALELGLANVRFERADLAELEALGEHDFVIAHGVYSWIDAGRREALRALARRALAPAGLAYVSFNAQPAWGVRGRVRDALVRAPAAPAAARERATTLRSILGEPENDWAVLLSRELERAADAPEAYFAHEYLAAHNDAFWLGEVARDFAGVGLAYVGDATFDRPEGFVDPRLRERIAELTTDVIAREELVDLLAYRQLCAAVFCREDAPRVPPAGPALLDEAWIASVVRATSDPFDPSPEVEERFVGPRGTEVRVASALAKIALLVLASTYPRAWRLDALAAEAAERLASYGVAVRPDERARLRAGLWELFRHIEIELRLEDAPVRTEPSARPVASALSRYEARARPALTTPLHTMLPLEPVDREIVQRLDGSRSAGELAAELARAIDRGEVTIEGAPSGAARVEPLMEARVAQTLTVLGWWGLAR